MVCVPVCSGILSPRSFVSLTLPMTRNFIFALMLAGTAAGAQARPDCQVVPKWLEAMRSCYRLLLVFAPSAKDGRLRRQASLLDAAADDRMDRFILFTPLVADGQRPPMPVDVPRTFVSADEISKIRAHFHIRTGRFVVLLVGEGGTVKLRSIVPVNPGRLNARIDRMPTRRREMLRRDAN